MKILPKILVAGRAGAGKSSLFNAILGENAFDTGVVPTTMGFDHKVWPSQWGEIEFIDSRGFGEAGSDKTIASGSSVIQQGYEEAHICLLVVTAGRRDLEPESIWVADAEKAGLFNAIPIFLVVSGIDQVNPVREWSPESLNLQSPTTAKEINIVACLSYLKTLPSFKRFFDQNRVIPISSGEPDTDHPENSRGPYGIQNLQDQIFHVLPEAAKTEYARVTRRLELAKISIKKLITRQVFQQIFYGIVLFTICVGITVFGLFSGMVVAHQDQQPQDDSFANSIALLFFLAAVVLSILGPAYFQFRMVHQIAIRHGFSFSGIEMIREIIRKWPTMGKLQIPMLEHLNTIVVCLTFFCCCCNPLGIWLLPIGVAYFFSRQVAIYFNEVFFNMRLSEMRKEVETSLKAGNFSQKPSMPPESPKPPPLPPSAKTQVLSDTAKPPPLPQSAKPKVSPQTDQPPRE